MDEKQIKSVKFSVYLPAELVEELDACATRNDRTRTLEIQRAIRQYVERERQAPKNT